MDNILSSGVALAIWRGLPFFMPAITALIVHIADRYLDEDNKDILTYIAAAGLLIAIILLWKMWMAGGMFYLGLYVSRFSMVVLLIILVLSMLVLFTFHQYYQVRRGNGAGSIEWFLLMVFGIAVATATSNLVAIFAGLSITSIAITFMLKDRTLWPYFLVTDLIFCLGVVFFFGATGIFSVDPGIIGSVNEVYTGNYFRVAMALIAVALFAKAAAVPFHWWTLDIARSCSLPLISSVTFLWRAAVLLVALKIFGPLAGIWGAFFEWPLAVIAVLTITWANLAAVRSHDMRTMLTYSSIAYTGYALALFPSLMVKEGGGAITIVTFVLAMAVAHIGALSLLQTLSTEKGDHTEFASLEGLSRSHPWISLILGLFLLALAGLPPFMGFMARIMMVRDIADSGNYILLAAVAFNMAIAVFYYTLPIARMYLFKPSEPALHMTEIGYPLIITIAVTSITVIYLGILPSTFLQWVQLSMR